LTGPGAAPGSGGRIGAYEIQGLLGRGGMGEVFLAWDARLRRRVAIKRIRHDHGLNPAMRQRLLREARAVAGLSHPAIVQVYDLLEDATGDCIVLEYVEGRTLAATLIEDGRLEPEAAVRLARESRMGLIEEARGHLRQILTNSPNNIFALDGLARIELLYGDLKEAERRYQDLLTRTPKPLHAHYNNLGAVQVLLGHYPEAIDAFNQALKIDPDDAFAYLNLAQAELALGNQREAVPHLQKALHEIESNPVPENQFPKAECLAFLGRKREAVAIILQLLQQKSDDPDVLKFAALVFAVVGGPCHRAGQCRESSPERGAAALVPHAGLRFTARRPRVSGRPQQGAGGSSVSPRHPRI
jgi:tetratricopeptide (TPR) repeat protein